MTRTSVGLFTAKLIGPDGFMEGRFFSTEKAAREWLMGAGLKSFEGDVKKAELCSPGDRLIWTKLRPKSEKPAPAARNTGLGWFGRPNPRAKAVS